MSSFSRTEHVWGNQMIGREELFERLRRGLVTFDWRGHHRGRVTSPNVPEEYQWEFRRDYPYEENAVGKLSLVVVREEITPCVRVPGQYGLECPECGQKVPLTLSDDGLRFVADGPCPYPEGHPEYSVTVSFPTGVVLFGDELLEERPPELEEHRGSGVVWQRTGMKGAAKIDFAHGYCGNTCPTVYRREDRKELLVAMSGWGEDGELLPFWDGYEDVGTICTDLWWWTVVDESIVRAKAAELGCGVYEDGQTTVEPGLWRAVQRSHLEDRDDHTPTVHARLEWIGSIEEGRG